MTALAADRDTKSRAGIDFSDPATAAVKIFAGALVVLDAAGNAKPGITATGLIARGVATEFVDNSAGLAGAVQVNSRKGVFPFANSAAGDAITRAEIGDVCYIVDDQTVAKTDGTGTRSAAGTIVDLDANGVWVKIA